jgi:hypothetical protein
MISESVSRAVASEAFEGLLDGASLATARGTEPSAQVEKFSSQKYSASFPSRVDVIIDRTSAKLFPDV